MLVVTQHHGLRVDVRLERRMVIDSIPPVPGVVDAVAIVCSRSGIRRSVANIAQTQHIP